VFTVGEEAVCSVCLMCTNSDLVQPPWDRI